MLLMICFRTSNYANLLRRCPLPVGELRLSNRINKLAGVVLSMSRMGNDILRWATRGNIRKDDIAESVPGDPGLTLSLYYCLQLQVRMGMA